MWSDFIWECFWCILCQFIPLASLNLWTNLWDKGITVSILMNRKVWAKYDLYTEKEKYLQKMLSTKHEQIWITEVIRWHEQCVISDLFLNDCCRNLANFAISLFVRRNRSYRDNKKKPSTFHIHLKPHGVGAATSTGRQNAVLHIAFAKSEGFLQPMRRFYKYMNNKIPALKFYRSTEADLCVLHM